MAISDNAGTGTQTITLKGQGVPQVSLSSASISFASLVVGVTSAPKAIILTNNLAVPLSISTVASSNADFTAQSGCGAQVAAKGTCSLSISFTPSAAGPRSGQVSVSDSATPSPQIVKVSGSGIAVKLLSISVQPAAASISLGSNQQFRAFGSYNNNTTQQDITNIAVWTSSSASVASISNLAGSKGLLKALASGSTTVFAKQDSVTGSTPVSVITVLTSIVVSPGTANVAAGTSQQFAAIGNYNDGSQKDLTNSANWSSSNTVVASISASGLAATASAGQVNISASLGTVNGLAQLTVQPAALTSLSVSPGIVWVGVGSNLQYSATGSFTDGTIKDMTHSVLWSSNNPAVATIDSFGLGTSAGLGSAMIIANTGTISGSATMNGVNGFVSCDARILDMKVLVVTSGQSEPDFPAITGALDYLGTPYSIFDMTTPGATITPQYLANGCHGYFQGVIFAIAGYRYQIPEIATLDTYEHDFQVRHLNWFAYPGTDFGLNPSTSSVPAVPPTPYPATYTSAGAAVFPYANTANPLIINYAQIYLSTPYNGASALLTDANGNALAVTYDTPWGSYQQLTLTFDSNPNLVHDLVLSQGLINWVTQGLFLGEHHTYFTPQVDDYFIDDAEWLPTTQCGTNTENTGATYRINAADLSSLINWQTTTQGQPVTSNFVTHMAFNGFGAQPGSYVNDDLTPATQANQASFKWISHTFDHTNLDSINYANATNEITQNNATASALGLSSFDVRNMVTPDISGLTNPNFLQAAFDNGIKYLVTDTSRPGYDNPTPNTGIPNPIQPSILMIPRHPSNLFFNVSTPSEWAAEYACIYPQLAYTYPQILDNISDTFLVNMLKGDIDPEMFHQPNLRAYDGTHSIFGDLMDATFNKYGNLVTFPVLSPVQDAIGASMSGRAQYDAAGVTGSFIAHQRVMLTAVQSATVPVTGLPSANAETYAGQTISHVAVAAGQTVTMPLP